MFTRSDTASARRRNRWRRTLNVSRAAALTALAAALIVPSTAMAAPDLLPAKYDTEPGSDVLISEIAAGGAGATSQANRNAHQNFIEITNYGNSPVDIGGWRIYRCGQTGGGYGPQAVVSAGTVLQPGDQYTAAAEGSSYSDADAHYGTNLHAFGFGAFLQDDTGQTRDAIGFYHADIHTECADVDGNWLQRGLQHRLDESHQRVNNTGNLEDDWVIAPRTVGAPNATEWGVPQIDNGLRFTEISNGGAASSQEQYVEITNLGDSTVDVGGYQFFRCGENGSQYLQHGNLPAKELAPGDTYLITHQGSTDADSADATYPTGMHWRDFGVMLLTGNDEIVDRVGVYDNRNSPCTNGVPGEPAMPFDDKPNHFANEALVRVDDTGDNSTDWALTTERTPGVYEAAPAIVEPTDSEHQTIKISELTGAGPAGGNDEFVELANYGDTPVNLVGWSAYRCYGTGQPGVGSNVQVDDLGDVTLEPGETYLMAASGAPADLREMANATYRTGLNHSDGYGMYITDDQNNRVDSVAVYDVNVNQYTPCREGEEVRNFVKYDQGESLARGQDTGDNEHDFVVVADRTPGQLITPDIIDPTQPLDGELDPVSVDTDYVPNTPSVQVTDTSASISVADQDGTTVTLQAHAAASQNLDDVVIYAGVSETPIPTALETDGEIEVARTQELNVVSDDDGFPFQRFQIPATEDTAEFIWSGTTEARNEIQLLAWIGSEWEQIEAAVPSADGDVVLAAEIPASSVVEGLTNLMVIDGPRTTGGLIDEIGVIDEAFANPGHYDFALNHMTDTQFYSEGFRDVFRQMASWVVANEDGRKIAYNSLTGDIIENWMNGNHSPERANREFEAAVEIMSLINDADIPNGVLPGNHDNFWGRNNDKYNEYFNVAMYQDKPWFGEAWRAGDNSAHTDYFSHEGMDFLVISLQYRPSMEQLEWANEQAQAHPDHNVIVAAHSYLHTSGERDNPDRRYTGNAVDIWEHVVAPNDNVFLVFGGHYHGVATNYADPVTGEQVDATPVGDGAVVHHNVGETSRVVVEMLADYQGYRSTQDAGNPNAVRSDLLDRDTGFQRLLQFDLDAGLMAVNAYSPTLDAFDAWRYDEPAYRGDNARYDASDDEFVAEISLMRDLTLESTAWAVTGPSTELASTTDMPVGDTFQITLPESDVDRVWYATATDAHGNAVATQPMLLAASETEPDEPEPTEPEPSEPEPTEPEPSEPEPTEPEPTEPAPSEPEPTEPEPTEPEPTDPEPTEPEPSESEPSEPTPGVTVTPTPPNGSGNDDGSEGNEPDPSESTIEPEEDEETEDPEETESATPVETEPNTTQTPTSSDETAGNTDMDESDDQQGGLASTGASVLALIIGAIVLIAAGLILAAQRNRQNSEL